MQVLSSCRQLDQSDENFDFNDFFEVLGNFYNVFNAYGLQLPKTLQKRQKGSKLADLVPAERSDICRTDTAICNPSGSARIRFSQLFTAAVGAGGYYFLKKMNIR